MTGYWVLIYLLKEVCMRLVLFLWVITACTACGQQLRELCTLPATLAENSGMLVSAPNRIWLHNDGGNPAKLYLIDTIGTILKEITIQNATNVDWEDMTTDYQGHLYVGDIGNNNNNRQNLRIYKIPHPDSIQGMAATAEVIDYYYGSKRFPSSKCTEKV